MIPFFDARAEYLAQRGEIDAAIRRVLLSGVLILGPELEAFESEFAAFVGARFGIGVASGTDAIELALRAVGTQPGDEVVTVANAGVPVVAAIRAAGALPRFADVSPDSLQMDPAAAAAAIGPRTRCLLPVHLYGQPAPIEDLAQVAAAHGLVLIEDCAQGAGARVGEKHVGNAAAIGCFSFYPTKNLGALGDAGMCVTADPALAERLRRMRTYGLGDEQSAVCEGVNSRLDELQAAVLRARLSRLADALAARRRLANRYDDALGTDVERPRPIAGTVHGHHLYVIRDPQRDATIARLQRAGISCRIHYPEPVHLMAAYEFLRCRPGELPVTERACREVLSLPLYPALRDADVDRIAAAVRERTED